MEAFEYYNPVKVVFGEGTLKQIGEIAKGHGSRALILTYEEHGFFQDVLDTIHSALDENGVAWVDDPGVTANPLLSQAQKGVDMCREHQIDLVIGLGGGSVMDCAKVIAAGVLYPHELKKMVQFSHSDVQSIPPTESLPTIMIPTLPGTGSEMNPTAVITDEQTRQKSYVWTPCLYPKAAVMDPELTRTLPAYQTACGALDIFAHVMEAYVNGDPAVNLTLQEHMQEGVMKAVLETLPVVWENPQDLQARGVLMWAASIALNGWLTTGTFGFTPMHQMGHVLSAQFGATHGATLACMMPAWMKHFAKKENNIKYAQLAMRIFNCGIEEAADKLEAIIRSYGVQSRISQFGAKLEDVDRLTDEVVTVSFGPDGLLNGHPKTTREDIRTLFEISL